MSDGKFFQRGIQNLNNSHLMAGKTHQLSIQLQNAEKGDVKFIIRRNILKKIVANISMGNDMAPLFPDVINCLSIPQLEVKKMVYLFLVTYGSQYPDMALIAVKRVIRVLFSHIRTLKIIIP